jgi:ornithine lipid ester-linked acyl 2-hydroxylase
MFDLLKWSRNIELKLHNAVFDRFRKHSLIGNQPFFSKESLRPAKELELAHLQIKAEVLKILERYKELTPFQVMSPDQESLSNDDRWKFFFLKCANIKFKKNAQMMPQTMAVIDKYPEIVSAYLSILAPHKSLPPHAGPWPGVLRAHLGVLIPAGKQKPHIIVDGFRYEWKEGEVVYFDDTYEHEAHNPTNEIRVVLFMDVLRPMSFPYNWVNRFILSIAILFPYIWIPYFRHKKWEKQFHKGKNG